jgi:hypothetical protein
MARAVLLPVRHRHPGSIFVVPGSWPGLVVKGNINLWQQPVIRNPNGSYSTVKSTSWREPIKVPSVGVVELEVLMPEVLPGHSSTVSATGALSAFRRTGRHLGAFASVAWANAYADALHLWYVRNRKWFLPTRRRR